MLRLFDNHPQTYAMPHVTGIITMLEKRPSYLQRLKDCKDERQLLSVISEEAVINNFRHIIAASLEGMKFHNNSIRFDFDFDFESFSKSFFEAVGKSTDLNSIVYSYFDAIKAGWKNCIYNDEENRVYVHQQGYRNYLYPGEDTVRFVMENVKNMVVVEMVRDPIYQINSAIKASEGLGIEEAIVSWGFAYNYLKHRSTKYPGSYMLARYEDLVEEPEEVMKQVAGFAEIDYGNILINPTFNGSPWFGNSSFKERSGLEFRKDIQLSEEQVIYIEKSLGVYRKELGYPELGEIL